MITICGRKHWPCRGVDPGGFVTDTLVQSHCNAAAKREIMPDVEHRSHKGINNCAEYAHQSTATAIEGDKDMQIARPFAAIALHS